MLERIGVVFRLQVIWYTSLVDPSITTLFARRKTYGASGFLAVTGNFYNSKSFVSKYKEVRVKFGEHTVRQ